MNKMAELSGNEPSEKREVNQLEEVMKERAKGDFAARK
jgi:hypothetical protein